MVTSTFLLDQHFFVLDNAQLLDVVHEKCVCCGKKIHAQQINTANFLNYKCMPID